MKNNMIKKASLIAAIFVLTVGISCSSPNKEKSANTTAEKNTILETVETNTETADPALSIGKKLYSDKGCLVCHQLNTKLVGPAVKDIAVAYSGKKVALTAFLKGQGKAIVDPSQASVMQPQIAITKALSASELNAVVDYILSIK